MSKFNLKNAVFKSFPKAYIRNKSNSFNRNFNLKAYNLIKENNLFDEEFYLKNYPEVANQGIDPILHYLFFGFNEGKEIGANFDGIYYLNKYPDAMESYKQHDLNPLVHYCIFGLKENRVAKLDKNINLKTIVNSKSIDYNSSIKIKKRILFVIHEKVGIYGGTGFTNKDIIDGIAIDYDVFILDSDSKQLNLWKKTDNSLDKLGQWIFNEDFDHSLDSKYYNIISKKSIANPKLESIYFEILNYLKPDIIHINHLIKHSYDLPKLATKLDIPYVLSIHDFYYICPSIHLIDENGIFCNQRCKKNIFDCNGIVCSNDLDLSDNSYSKDLNSDSLDIGSSEDLNSDLSNENSIKHLTGEELKKFNELWHEESLAILNNALKVVCPSEYVYNMYESEYSLSNLLIIEHGRDFNFNLDFDKNKDGINFTVPNLNENPIKILFPGHISQHKGSLLIKDLKNIDKDNKLDLYFLGTTIPNLSDCGTDYGRYNREDFLKYVSKIKPSFISILSTCPETYSHTLSEAWAVGVPVLATDLGALKERIAKTNGGWTLNYKSSKSIYGDILKIANDKDDYWAKVENIRNIDFKTKNEMVDDYKKIYEL